MHVSAAEQTGLGTGVSVGVGEGVVRGECEGRECEGGGSVRKEGVVRGECEGEGMGSCECEGEGVGRGEGGEHAGDCCCKSSSQNIHLSLLFLSSFLLSPHLPDWT